MNINKLYWIHMLVVTIVQFAAKSTQKTAMHFSNEMYRKWRPSNKSRNVIGQTLFIHGSVFRQSVKKRFLEGLIYPGYNFMLYMVFI